jgi:hypothetical protein
MLTFIQIVFMLFYILLYYVSKYYLYNRARFIEIFNEFIRNALHE